MDASENLDLAELEKMASLGRLTAGIIHEINTPLSAMVSNNALLARSLDKLQEAFGEGGPDALKRAGEIVAQCAALAEVDRIACERITSIVRGLRSFSRVDDSEVRPVDLKEIISDTVKLAGAEFRRKVTVETDFATLPAVECQPQLLGQVILNLVVNASHAMDGSGVITIRTRLDGSWAHIAVADTGSGIRPEDQSRIFQSGFTTKPRGVGTGLGLWISKQIIEQAHRGRLDFESEPGAGTTFHIRIPLKHARP